MEAQNAVVGPQVEDVTVADDLSDDDLDGLVNDPPLIQPHDNNVEVVSIGPNHA